MNATLLRPRERHWECPSCGLQHVSYGGRPQDHEMHNCVQLKGLSVPFVEVHGNAQELKKHAQRLRLVAREDYTNGDMVRVADDGFVPMAVITDRADGTNDCHVYAPCATAEGVSHA